MRARDFFVRNLLLSIGVEVVIPAPLFVDTLGAISIAKNASTKGCTTHMDIRLHFVQELIDEGIIILKFVRGEDNAADIFTKNTSRATFDALTSTRTGSSVTCRRKIWKSKRRC